MAISRTINLLRLLLPLSVIAGCAQDGSFRSAPRSIASVGDKTEVIVSGEPGASIASTVPDFPPDRKQDSKISGRVVDDHGRAVPNANIRLAIAGAKGGRIETVEADSSGAFTLHRLKQGSSYVVIAEAEDGDDTLVGRVEARAPQTSLKIRVYPRGENSDHFRTSSNTSRRRVGTASNIKEQDEEEVDLDRPTTRSNREDIEPPAPEAESLTDRLKGNSETEIRDDPEVDLKDEVEAIDRRRSNRSRQSRKPKFEEPIDETDDGENPLPPAIEAADNEEEPKSAFDEPEPTKPLIASRDKEPLPGRPQRIAAAEAQSADPSIFPSLDVPALNGAKDSQVVVASAPALSLFEEPRQTKPRKSPAARRPRALQQLPAVPAAVASASMFEIEKPTSHSRASSATLAKSDQVPPVGSTSPAKAIKWREIVENKEVPIDESLRKRPPLFDRADIPTATVTAVADASIAQSGSRIRRDPSLRMVGMSTRSPRHELANRRIYDVQLPNTEGKLISLKDFDSELILLDFWGTWCAPCKTSIPQLIEFQKRFGANRLQVVGIACERASVGKRVALVAKSQKELAMNYPVMIVGKDDPCPLTDSLQVQFYPTMILLNRKGEVILREQGATEATLGRLERTIESSLQSK